MYKTKNKKTQKHEVKKTDWLGNFGPKEKHDDEFSEFSFGLVYPKLGGEETGNP